MKKELLARLSAYLPMDRRQALAQNKELPDRTQGVALFADISGFTPLTRTLTEELGRRAGAEEVLRQINPVFEMLIGHLHRHRGAVIGFAGDSITCWFDGGEHETLEQMIMAVGPQALRCALAMQQGMGRFTQRQTAAGTPLTLGLKVALAAGPVRRFKVGQPTSNYIDVLAGETLQRMAAAEEVAQAGQVVVSQELAPILQGKLFHHQPLASGGGRFYLVSGVIDQKGKRPSWPALSLDQLSLKQLQSWLLPPIFDRLKTETADQPLGDLRPVTPLFLRFSGLDFDSDDEAGVKLDRFIRRVQQVAGQYDGHIIQLTLGDKGAYLYLVFGAPIAHEDDPYRALATALALRELPAELAFIKGLQIGVSRGEVWTGLCGASSRYCYGVMGNEVNLSARLMIQAEPGQIVVSGAMAKEPAFHYQYVGELSYKGFDQPLSTYKLLGFKTTEEKVFKGNLLGRQRELERLIGLIAKLTGQFAAQEIAPSTVRAVTIYGEPGIGKSHLVYAAQQRLTDQSGWLLAQTEQILRKPFNPFIFLLQNYFEQEVGASTEENKDRFWHKLDRLLKRLAEEETAVPQHLPQELQRTVPFLGALLNLYWPHSLYEQLDAEGRYYNTLAAIRNLLLAESCLQPLILHLEDAHWLDAASHELLTTITQQLADRPIFLIITSRYTDTGARPLFQLAETCPQQMIELSPLSAAELHSLLEDILQGPVHAELHHLIADKSQANPFFAQQLLYYFQENRLLIQVEADSGRPLWCLPQDAFDLPPTLNTVLIARLDRLAEEVKRVVQTAAVLGREFDTQLLSRMLRDQLAPLIQQAEAEQIWTALNNLRYLFNHALLRDAAYEMQLRSHLRRLHLAAADAYAQLDQVRWIGEIAYHYERAYQLGEEASQEQACDYLTRAGQQAAENYENEMAANYFSRALQVSPAEGRFHLLLAREKVHHDSGARQQQAADLAQLATLAARARERAEVAIRQGWYHNAVGDYETAVDVSHQAIHWSEEIADSHLLARSYLGLGQAQLQLSHFQQAETTFQTALEYAQAAERPIQKSRALGGLGHVADHTGRYEQAQQYHQQALTIRQQIGDRRGEGQSYYNLSLSLLDMGDLAQSQSNLQEALAISREIGDRQLEGNALNQFGFVKRIENDYLMAERYARQSLTIAREINSQANESFALNILGVIAYEQGDLTIAQDYLLEAWSIRKRIGNQRGSASTLNNLGLVMMGQGDYAQAGYYYAEALRVQEEIGDTLGQTIAQGNLALIAAYQARYQVAQQHYEQALAISRQIENPLGEGRALHNLANVFRWQGQLAQAEAASRQALRLIKGVGNKMGALYILNSLGQTLIQQEAWQEATAVAQQAHALSQENGWLDLGVESLTNLALIAFKTGQLAAALAKVDDIFSYLQEKERLPSAEDPFGVYYSCYQILQTANDPRMDTFLTWAYQQLQKQAGHTVEQSWPPQFLAQPDFRAVIEAFEKI